MKSIFHRVSQFGGVVLGMALTMGSGSFATVQKNLSHSLVGQSIPTPEAFLLPAPELSKQQQLDLWATYYYVHGTESTESGYALLTPKGADLGEKVSHRDWCYGALQGTIRVKGQAGATVYNYAGRHKQQQVDCSAYFSLPQKIIDKIGRVRFGHAIGPYGDGVKGMILVPYRSIAVDPKVIPYGSVLFIPDAKGMKVTLPSGQQVEHDGYFFAADTGSAIKQQHIDVFIGDSDINPFANFVKSHSDKKFTAYVMKSDRLNLQLSALHKPNP